MLTFLHIYHPQPILLQLGPIAIHWYGLLMVFAIVSGFFAVRYWWKRYDKKFPISPAQAGSRRPLDTLTIKVRDSFQFPNLHDLFFWLVIWGFVGARLYHVINEPVYYFRHPLEIVAVWRGGLAIHGAMIAGVIVIYWFVKRRFLSAIPPPAGGGIQKQTKNKKNFFSFFLDPRSKSGMTYKERLVLFLSIADILVIGLALGQSIGRWGNYFNQELYGRLTGVAWGIPIDLANRVGGFTQYEYFHPTFLYESIGSLMVFGVLGWMHRIQSRSHIARMQNTPRPDATSSMTLDQSSSPSQEEIKSLLGRGVGVGHAGFIFATYLFLYSLLRIFVESFRIDAVPVVLGARLPVLMSMVLIVLSVVLSLYVRKTVVFSRAEP